MIEGSGSRRPKNIRYTSYGSGSGTLLGTDAVGLTLKYRSLKACTGFKFNIPWDENSGPEIKKYTGTASKQRNIRFRLQFQVP
jgi:hypothetical protein